MRPPIIKRADWLLLSTLAALMATLTLYNRFIDGVELRSGVTLPDPILPLITPRDTSWPAFLLLYGALAVAFVSLLGNRRRMIFAMHAYMTLVLVRMAVMFLIPLEPPAGMVLLRDPLVGSFVQAKGLTKDLFFSGHTSTLFLLHLVSEGRILRLLFLAGTALAALLVLVAHVHYLVDVAAAPFFSYGCYRVCVLLHRRFAGSDLAPRAPRAA